MKILITGAGGAAAISVWKSLKEETIFMADIDPCAAGLYLVPEKQRLIVPKGDAADFVPTLLALCEQNQIQVVILTVDAELIPVSLRIDEFQKRHIKVPMSDLSALMLCRDKWALLTHCKDEVLIGNAQLWIPETKLNKDDFPLFVKPRSGSGSAGTQYIANVEALASVPQDGSYLLQTYLSGEEYSVDVFLSERSEPIASVARLRMKIDSGIAVAAKTFHNAELTSLAIKVAKAVNIKYVANIQFKLDKKGRYHLLEINPRFPGTLPLTVQAGVNMPKLLLQALESNLHMPIESLLPYNDIMVVRYLTEKYIAIDEWEALCLK